MTGADSARAATAGENSGASDVDATLRRQWQEWIRGNERRYFIVAMSSALPLIAVIGTAIEFKTFGVLHVLGSVLTIGCWIVAYSFLARNEHPVVRWDCPACGKRLDTDQSWICGACDHENHSYHWSFLNACARCQAEPPGYVCHHCDAPTWFGPGGDRRHPARRVPDARAGETLDQARERREREIAERRHEIDRLKHEAEIRNLTLQLDRLRHPTPTPDDEAVLEQHLQRALQRLRVGLTAVARSTTLQAQVEQEIAANAPNLSRQDIERLQQYARDKFDAYRENISLGRYEQ